MTPRDEAINWRLLRLSLPNTPGLRDVPALEAKLRQLEAMAGEPVVFRMLDGDDTGAAVYEIGRGDDVRTVTSLKRGIFAMWRLLDSREPLDPVEIARPGARKPATTVYQAIRGEACDEFARWGMRDLCDATAWCTTRRGMLLLRLPINAPTFITGKK